MTNSGVCAQVLHFLVLNFPNEVYGQNLYNFLVVYIWLCSKQSLQCKTCNTNVILWAFFVSHPEGNTVWLTFNPRGTDFVAFPHFPRFQPQCRQSSLMLTLSAPLCTLPAPQCQMLRSEFSLCLAAEWRFVLWTKQSPEGSHVLRIHHVSTFPASLSLPPGSCVDDVLSLSQSNCGERWASPWWGWARRGARAELIRRMLLNLLSRFVSWGNYSFKAVWKQ